MPTIAAVAVAMLLFVGSASPAAAAEGASPGRFVALVMVRDLTWSNGPPRLDGFAKASLSMRSAAPQSRAADTLLTLGKGARSAALESATGVGPVDLSRFGGLRLRAWPALTDRDAGVRQGGHLGTVGTALRDNGLRWGLAADDPAAPAAAADGDGIVPWVFPGTVDGVRDALHARLDALFVAVPRSSLTEVLDALDGACTLVVSASTPAGNRRLGVFAASRRCGLGVGGVASPSTHHAHLVTLPDASATFLALAGVPVPASMAGGPVAAAPDIRRAGLVARDQRAQTADRARVTFVWLFILLHAAGAVLAVRFPKARTVLCCALLSIPAASFMMMLLPWWRAGPLAGLALGGTLAALLAIGAALVVRRDVMLGIGVLTAVTSAVVALDALLASPLQVDAPFGNSPVSAGRFYGVGNIDSGFLVAGLLVTGGLALDRWGRRALPWVGLVLAVGTIAGGAPRFGADVGGVLYAVPAYGLLLLGAMYGRVTVRHLAVVAVAAVAAVALFAGVDLLGEAGSRTHLARGLAQGGLADAVVRKAALALRTVKVPIAAVVAIAAAALSSVRFSPGGRPALRVASRALLAAAVLGSALNDSGLIVAAAVLAVAWPAGVVLVAEPSPAVA